MVLGISAYLLKAQSKRANAEMRFNRPSELKEFLIESSKGIKFKIQDRAALAELKSLLNKSNTEFLEITAPGSDVVSVSYEAIFDDGAQLEYTGTLMFYRDRTYLYINFNEDMGWMSGPSSDIRLEPSIDSTILREMRSTFKVESDRLPDWKSPATN